MAETGKTDTEELHRVIDEVRGQVCTLLRWHGFCMAAVVGLSYLLVGILAAQLVPQIARIPSVYWTILAALVGITYWFFGIRPRHRYRTDEQVALLIQREMPELEDAPINSVQLERRASEDSDRFSGSLAEGYLQRAAEEMRGISSQVTVQEIPVFRSLGGCALLLALLLTYALIAPKSFETSFVRLRGHISQVGSTAGKMAGLQMRDLEVTYYYPDYLGRSPKNIEGEDGTLVVPAGTRVRLTGKLQPEVAGARLVMNGQNAGALQLRDDAQFEVEFSVLDGGTYYIEDAGSSPRRTAEHEINIVKDAAPEIHIDRVIPQPGEDDVLDLEGGDAVRIRFRGSDDFGLSEIFLEFRYSGEMKTRMIRSFGGSKTRASGTYEWVVPAEILRTTGKSSFRIGARDADNISGPKTSYSRGITIKSLTDEMQHARLLARQEKLLRNMVRLLGTELTLGNKKSVSEVRRRLRRELLKVLTANRKVVEKMKDDPLADGGMFDALKEMLKRREEESDRILGGKNKAALLTRRWEDTVAAAEWAVPRMEEDVLRLDDLLQMDHMRAVRRMAKRLKKMQKSLRKMLKKMRRGKLGEKEKARLKSKIESMQRMMKRLRRQMAKTVRRLERGFFNPDALESAENREEVTSALEKLKKMAQSGQMQGAMTEAQRLQKQLDQMLSSLDQTGKRLAKNRLGPRMKKMRELNQGFQEVRQMQSKVARDTAAAQEEMRETARKQMRKMMNQRIERNIRRAREIENELESLRKDLGNLPGLDKYRKLRNQLRSTLDEMARSRSSRPSDAASVTVDDATRRKLQKIYRKMSHIPGADAATRVGEDLPQAIEGAGKLQKMLKNRRIQKSLDRVSVLNRRMKTYRRILRNGRISEKKVDRMNDSLQKGGRIESELKDLLDKLKKRMQQQQRKRAARKKMDNLQQRQKQVGAKLQKVMKKAGESMRSSITKRTQRARGEMKNAADDLSGKKVGKAHQHQKKALEALQKAQGKTGKAMQQMKQQMQGRRAAMPEQGGRRGRAGGRVRIPETTTPRGTEDFRREIKRILEGGLPDLYRDSNQEYYEELVQ